MEQDQQPQKLNIVYLFMMPFFLLGAIGSFAYLQHKKNDCVTYYDKTGIHALWKDCTKR